MKLDSHSWRLDLLEHHPLARPTTRGCCLMLMGILAGCAGPQVVGDGIGDPSRVLDIAVVDGCDEEEGQPVSITGAELYEQYMLLDLSHEDGCQEHSYRLCPSYKILTSQPPQHDLWVVRESQGEDCDQRVQQPVRVDLSALVLPVTRISELDGRRVRVILKEP